MRAMSIVKKADQTVFGGMCMKVGLDLTSWGLVKGSNESVHKL